MPITRRQFELEIDTKTEEWMDTIKVFLAEHKSEAFTLEELRRHFSPVLVERLSDLEKKMVQAMGKGNPFNVPSDEKGAFDLALEKLVEQNMVEKRIVRGTPYYAYPTEVLPF